MDTKPELEIYADDVKCSHGATTGQVDDEALFYLRSRGIPEGPARALLIEGFLAELVEGIACDNVRSAALGKIREWLKKIE
jgi:Fe-S cluster assembly protein SufD